MAELISMRLLPLWVGARGIEFSWKYIQLSFEANISLVSCVFVYNVQCTFVRLFVSESVARLCCPFFSYTPCARMPF